MPHNLHSMLEAAHHRNETRQLGLVSLALASLPMPDLGPPALADTAAAPEPGNEPAGDDEFGAYIDACQAWAETWKAG
jgi:hypothetical protein